MNSNPLVSVIIPVYNGEQYVKPCLDMMMSQSYKNLEIIVVNDGSADNSAVMTEGYQVKLINHEKNRGLSAARNTGIDAANGEFIHFMDVDDEINSDYYKALVEAITETGADVACSGMVNIARPQKAQRFKKRLVYTLAYDRLEATYVGKIGYVWRYLFNLDFLKANNLRFQEGRLMEDLMFSLPALYFANSLVVVPGAEYIYCHQPNSIMTTKDPEHAKKRRVDRQHAKDMMRKFAKDHQVEIPGVTTGKLRYIIKKWIG
jgi:glycosyltransferase involved in cell wall biosynthesis